MHMRAKQVCWPKETKIMSWAWPRKESMNDFAFYSVRSKSFRQANLWQGHFTSSKVVRKAVVRMPAPHADIRSPSGAANVRPFGAVTGAATIAWVHPAGPLVTRQNLSITTSTSESSVELLELLEESESESLDQDTKGCVKMSGTNWKSSSPTSAGNSRSDGKVEHSNWKGGSGVGLWDPRPCGLSGRQPALTCVEISVCSQIESTVSSREYNCTLSALWCPWSLRARSSKRSWAAAAKKVTLIKCKVNCCASSGDNMLEVQGVCTAQRKALRAAT